MLFLDEVWVFTKSECSEEGRMRYMYWISAGTRKKIHHACDCPVFEKVTLTNPAQQW
jgi:hypothetical protein